MKKSLSLIALMSLFFCISISSCHDPATARKGEVTIIDIRNDSKEPEENLTAHKQYDVEVYRTILMDKNTYSIRHYHKENDTLRSHKAHYGTEDVFDKAAYNWLSDTTVSITLYNTASKKEIVLKVSGYGSTSSISN